MKYKGIKGLRGFAALLIVLSHFDIINQGGVGNAIFFCISGFLAKSVLDYKKPFTLANLKTLGLYYLRKFLRIWPAFAVVIIFSHMYLASDAKTICMNLIFVERDLWFVSTILLAYLFWPFIDLIIEIVASVVKTEQNCNFMRLFLSIVICGGSYFLFSPYNINNMSGFPEGFRLFQFLIGVCVGRVYDILKSAKRTNGNKKLACIIGILNTMLVFLTSDQVLRIINPVFNGYYVGWELPVCTTLVVGILLICIVLYPDTGAGKIFQWKLFAWYGAISFDLYMIHTFVMSATNLSSNWKTFLFTFVFSTCFSYFLYKLVERPSTIFSKTLKFSSLRDYYKKLDFLLEE